MLAGSVVDESAATSSPLEFSLRMPPVGGRATAAPLARGHRYLTMHPWGGAGWGRRLSAVSLQMLHRQPFACTEHEQTALQQDRVFEVARSVKEQTCSLDWTE